MGGHLEGWEERRPESKGKGRNENLEKNLDVVIICTVNNSEDRKRLHDTEIIHHVVRYEDLDLLAFNVDKLFWEDSNVMATVVLKGLSFPLVIEGGKLQVVLVSNNPCRSLHLLEGEHPVTNVQFVESFMLLITGDGVQFVSGIQCEDHAQFLH